MRSKNKTMSRTVCVVITYAMNNTAGKTDVQISVLVGR